MFHAIRALKNEFHLPEVEFTTVVSAIQNVIENSPSYRLEWKVPIIVQTSQEARNSLALSLSNSAIASFLLMKLFFCIV